MGITGQGSCLYKSVELKSTDIYHVVHQQYKLNNNTSTTTTNNNNYSNPTTMTTTTTRTRTRPRVVIDANPVGYPFISKAVGPARAVVSIAKEFVEAGIDVIIVCDNQNKRHHSKRATIQRRGVIERGKIQLVEKRIILSNLLRSSTSSSPDSLKNIKTIQREIKKLEKGTGQILPTDFVEQIQQQVQHYESNRTSKSIIVVIAPFQADPEVARRVICGDADCIVSIDSDYQMLLGSSTPNDITIRHIILNNSTLKIRTAVLVTGQKKVRDWIAEVLPTADNKPYFPKAPPCPIFDKLNDPTCRAMLAVALGSDVFCGGVNKFGPQKAYTIKQQIDKLDSDAKKQQHIISSIIKYKTDTNININALLCYTQALLYELTCDGYMYKDDKPERLDAYLKEFKCYETTTITDGVSILTCPGLNNNNHSEHNFIPFCEGEYLCNKCNKIYCQYCTYDTNTDGGSFICIQCKHVSLSINTSSLPTEAVMRKELMNAGTDVPASATYIDVVDTYEESKESGTLSLPVDYSRVPFPLEPSSIFHVSQNKLQDVSEPKIMTDINHFIHDNNINSTNKAKFVTIVASFVDLSSVSCNETKIGDHWKSLIPKSVLNMANNSRLHEGERLCKRGIRHAMDKASPAMLQSTISLCMYGNNNNNNNNNDDDTDKNTAIRIKKKVKPSMKAILYDTEVCFNHDSLIACSCTCKAGCRTNSLSKLGTERNFCTHGASILMGLSLLLFDGLAEHLLVELRARLSSDNELGTLLNREDVFLLMTACGKKNSDLLVPNGPSIFDCLEEFSVGTDLSKSCGRVEARTTPRVYCLLRNFKLKNPLTEAAKIITTGTKEKIIVHDSVSGRIRTAIRDGKIPPELLPFAIERLYHESSLREDTVQESNATSIYDYLLSNLPMFLSLNNSTTTVGTTTATNEPEQPLYEIDIYEGIGSIDREEYKTVQYCIDGLNHYLHTNNGNLLTKTNGGLIGYSVLHHRSSFAIDASIKHKRIAAFTNEWKHALSIGTGDRYSPKKHISTSMSVSTDATLSESSRKRPLNVPTIRQRKRCCIKWCQSSDKQLKRVPTFPKPIIGDNRSSKAKMKTRAKKVFIRREFLERLGLQRVSKENETKDVRYCTAHVLEEITKSIQVNFDDGTTESFRHTFMAPVQTAKKSFVGSRPVKLSKGTGIDRSIARTAQSVVDKCGSNRSLLYDIEMQRQHESLGLGLVNPNVGNICGVVNIDDSHNTNSDYYETPRKQKGTKRTARNNYYTGESSLFTMKNLTCTEIKRRTGYADISALLSFVVVVCGGEMDVIIKTCSKLTWLEEWILYLQYIYGHSIKRWVDYAKEYNLKMEYCRRIFRSKLEIVITARKRWPMYATHREDVLFRDSKWENDVGNDTRIIMHDNTNVSLPTASDGDQQRSLYSEYYGECCAKGGVCIQFCGWIRSTHLVTGHACDKTSTELTKVLPQQQQFQEHDKINNAIVPFLLILDKGYRITMLAKEYNQGCWQPIFAKSDEQFQRNHLLLSAGVAVNRSGNERGVKYMKLSRLIGQGVKYGNFDLATVDDIWLAWGFQVNFMYQTVL